MTAMSDYLENKLTDLLLRGQSFTPPTNVYVALFRATAGVSPRSTAVTTGQTTVPATSNGRMYRCTTGGTTGSGEPTWGTTSGGTTSDGTAVWTEMTPDFEGNTSNLTSVEVSGNAYARVTVACSLAAWAGTQGAGTTVASTGSSGTTSNNSQLNFPAPTPAAWGVIAAVGVYDASSSGNQLFAGVLSAPQTTNIGAAPYVSAGALQVQFDN